MSEILFTSYGAHIFSNCCNLLHNKNEFVSNRILETINILISRKMFVYNVGDGRIIIFLSFELKYYLGVFN